MRIEVCSKATYVCYNKYCINGLHYDTCSQQNLYSNINILGEHVQ